MKTRRIIASAGIATAGALLAIGCGGGAQSAGTAPAGAGGGAFVERASAICAAANDDFVALGNTQEYEDLADFRARFGRAIAIAKKQYATIAALEPPARIADKVTAYVAEGRKSVALSQELYDRVVAGAALADAETATIGSPKGTANVEARRSAALAAGLEACAS